MNTIKLTHIEELLTHIVSLMQHYLEGDRHYHLLTQKELLKVLNISPNTLKSWENTGLKRLEPPIEGTRLVFYKIDDVIKYLTP